MIQSISFVVFTCPNKYGLIQKMIYKGARLFHSSVSSIPTFTGETFCMNLKLGFSNNTSIHTIERPVVKAHQGSSQF